MSELTIAFERAKRGGEGAAERLAALLYEEIRAMARREMAHERADHTLQPTALVHEAWMRLAPEGERSFENRAHFLGAAANAIRRVLVEHARARARVKRGEGRARIELADVDPAAPVRDEWLLDLDEALSRLAAGSPSASRIVELRFFGGMSIPEVAETLGISESTVERRWRVARAWLRGEIEESDGEQRDGP